MTQHWQRDEPTFYNFLALERNPLDAPDILAGLSGALMSTDPKSGAFTYVLNVPAGFKGRTDANLASLEFFVLSGDLALNGEQAGAGCYLHLPQLGDHGHAGVDVREAVYWVLGEALDELAKLGRRHRRVRVASLPKGLPRHLGFGCEVASPGHEQAGVCSGVTHK